MLVENIIHRNVIITVDNHFSMDDFFYYHPLQNVIFFFIIPNIILVFSNHGARSSKDNAMRTC